MPLKAFGRGSGIYARDDDDAAQRGDVIDDVAVDVVADPARPLGSTPAPASTRSPSAPPPPDGSANLKIITLPGMPVPDTA